MLLCGCLVYSLVVMICLTMFSDKSWPSYNSCISTEFELNCWDSIQWTYEFWKKLKCFFYLFSWYKWGEFTYNFHSLNSYYCVGLLHKIAINILKFEVVICQNMRLTFVYIRVHFVYIKVIFLNSLSFIFVESIFFDYIHFLMSTFTSIMFWDSNIQMGSDWNIATRYWQCFIL